MKTIEEFEDAIKGLHELLKWTVPMAQRHLNLLIGDLESVYSHYRTLAKLAATYNKMVFHTWTQLSKGDNADMDSLMIAGEELIGKQAMRQLAIAKKLMKSDLSKAAKVLKPHMIYINEMQARIEGILINLRSSEAALKQIYDSIGSITKEEFQSQIEHLQNSLYEAREQSDGIKNNRLAA